MPSDPKDASANGMEKSKMRFFQIVPYPWEGTVPVTNRNKFTNTLALYRHKNSKQTSSHVYANAKTNSKVVDANRPPSSYLEYFFRLTIS